ncbi:MAG: hypothetical protein OEY86_00915 [Nitrospira sp.]|nr:hypothetical protein [Nitrospira sp.]
MSGMYIRDAYLYRRSRNAKWNGVENQIPGKPLYVAPNTAYVAGFTVAEARSWARENNQFVYDTINLAYADVVDGRGDAIVLLPGTHTLTANLAVAKSNLSFWGADAWAGRKVRKPTSIVKGIAGSAAFAITGADVSFQGLTCVPITALSFATFTGAADGLTVENCYFDMVTPVVNIATEGFTGSAAIDNLLFKGNVAWSDGAQGPVLELTGNNMNGKLENNHYHVDTGTWASAVNLIDIDGIVVENDLATCGGTAMTACFTGSGTTVIAGAVFRDCRKGVLVTLLVDGFGTTSHAELVNNYTATVGGGTGSTLVTVVT